MFGYVMVNRDALSPEEQERFQAHYCGLCRTLRRRHGLSGQMTLSFDMTFLQILLSSLYEPEETTGRARCIVHPKEKRPFAVSEVADYAADMNVALAYHKLMDDWRDERKLLKRCQAGTIQRQYRRVEKTWPEKCRAIETCIRELSKIEEKHEMDIDSPANCFGALLGELFVFKNDRWADTLRRMGEALGRFIYVMDAYDDLPEDEKKGNFNPIRVLEGENFEENCFRALELLVAQCTEEFECLPLVQDVGILRNVLYSGVWVKHRAIRRRREAERKGETE